MSSSQAQQQQQAGSGAQLKRTSSKHFVVGTHHRNASVGKNLNRLNRLEQMTPPQQSPAAQVPPGFIPPHAGLAGQFGVKSQQLAQQADALRKSKSSDALLRRSASGLALTGRKGSRVNLVAGKRTLSALTPAQPKSRRHKHPDKHSKKSSNTSSATAKGQSDDEEEEEEEEEDEIGLSIEVPPRRLSTFAGIERDQKASAAFMSEADSELNRVQQRASSTSAPASGSQSLLASPVNSTKQLDPNNKSALLNAVDEAANTIAKDQQKQQQQQQQADEKTSLSAELRRGMQDPIPTPTQPDGSVDSNPAIRSRFLVDQQASSAGSSRFNPSQPQPSAAHISASQAAARELTAPHSVLSSSADSNSSTWVPTQHAMHPTTDTTQQTQTEQHAQSQATPPTPGPSATAAYSPRPHLITDAEASAAAAAAAAAAVAAVANTDVFPKMPAGASLADIAAAAAASEGSTHAQQRYMFKQHQHQHESNSASSTSSPGGASRSGEQQTSSSQLSASALLAAAAGGPAAQRELDSLSKELKNVKRYRDPAVEAIERVRVRVMANSVGLGEPIAGAKMVWSFSAVPGRDSTPEQEEKEAIEFVRAGKAVTSEELGRVLMRMWSGKWKLIDETNSNSSSSITGGNVAPPNTPAGSATPTNARTNATRPQMTMHQSSPHLSRPPTNGTAAAGGGTAGAGTRAGPPGSGLPNTAGVRATNLGTVSAGGGVNPLRRM